MTRTERLEAAMRTAMDMLQRPKNQHSNGEAAATILEVALADTSTSCCEEVRRAALEEAAKYVELEWEFDRPASGVRTPNGERARRVAAGIRALSNQAPPKSRQDIIEECLAELCEHVGRVVEPELVTEIRNELAPKSIVGAFRDVDATVLVSASAPPVCPTCGGTGRVRPSTPCPDCAGGGK